MLLLLVLTALSACSNESVDLVVINARNCAVDTEQPWTAALAIKEAIHAYTVNAAWQLRQEDKTGIPEAGKHADFIGLDQDLLENQPGLISETKAIPTVIDGRIVYERQ